MEQTGITLVAADDLRRTLKAYQMRRGLTLVRLVEEIGVPYVTYGIVQHFLTEGGVPREGVRYAIQEFLTKVGALNAA